jgi:hypothetical protein
MKRGKRKKRTAPLRTYSGPGITRSLKPVADSGDRDSAFDVLNSNTSPFTKILPRSLDPIQEPRVILQAILKPILFRRKANEHTDWLPVTGYYNFGLLRQPEVL